MLIRKLLGRSAKSIAILRHNSSGFLNPRRFYKEVTVNPIENKYEIFLDARKLKTPKGNQLILDSEPLALAIAQEWDSQTETIKIPLMRLTGLAFTTTDNPYNETSESLTDKIIEYLENDTLLYMSETPQELYELEQQKWLPVINWVNEKHELNLHPSYSVTELATIPEDSRLKLYRHISSMGFPALNGMLYGVGTIKSVLLMLACLQAHLSVEETVHLAYLEQAYQTKIYKKIESHHDVEEHDSINRLSAAIFYIKTCIYNETKRKIDTIVI